MAVFTQEISFIRYSYDYGSQQLEHWHTMLHVYQGVSFKCMVQLRCNFSLTCKQFTLTLEQFTGTSIEQLVVCALLPVRNSRKII